MGMKTRDLEDELRESDRRVAAWMQGVEEEDLTDNCMQSEWNQEDRKFASQAVAFVIKHSRKGIVSLCASVATLMQEKANLQKQLRDLQDKNQGGQLNSNNSPLTSPSSAATTRKYKQKHYSGKHVSALPSSVFESEWRYQNALQNGRKNSSVSSSLSSKNESQGIMQIVPNKNSHSMSPHAAEHHITKSRKLEKCPAVASSSSSVESHHRNPKAMKKLAVIADVCQSQATTTEEQKQCNTRLYNEPCGTMDVNSSCARKYSKETSDVHQEEQASLCTNTQTTTQCADSDLLKSSPIDQTFWPNRSERIPASVECDLKNRMAINRHRTITGHFQDLCPLHNLQQKLDSEKLKNGIMKKWLSLQTVSIKVKWQEVTDKWTDNQSRKIVTAPSPFKGCVCNICWEARSCSIKESALLWKKKPFLKVEDDVVLHGDLVGKIFYLGHLDGCSPQGEIFIGVRFDEAVGDTNGIYQGKNYFECPHNHGMFLLLADVICLLRKPEYSMDSLYENKN